MIKFCHSYWNIILCFLMRFKVSSWWIKLRNRRVFSCGRSCSSSMLCVWINNIHILINVLFLHFWNWSICFWLMRSRLCWFSRSFLQFHFLSFPLSCSLYFILNFIDPSLNLSILLYMHRFFSDWFLYLLSLVGASRRFSLLHICNNFVSFF